MSDLTRLNPTPHAIAVYASQPLSPVATQHSLPSRTLPFTWAGLSPAGSHQLCLAHSLDHSVGDQQNVTGAGRVLDIIHNACHRVFAVRMGMPESSHASE